MSRRCRPLLSMTVVDSEPLISFKADAEEARARD
jgi:hypothetical protein